jgi:hypothetical protein
LKPLWSQPIAVAPRGLALVREKGWMLTWDEQHWLYLLNRSGERQGQVRPPGAMTTACAADDGSAFAAGGAHGEVWWLAPDLAVRWERQVPDKVLATAMDPFGQYVAVADAGGHLRILDRLGHLVTQIESPRPLHHLAFVPAAPFLVVSSDFGLVACLDLAGKWIWRDGLVVHIGGLAVNGNGSDIVLACFTEGLRRYSVKGRDKGRPPVAHPSRLVALNFEGDLIAAADLAHRLLLFDRAGRVIFSHGVDGPAVALGVSALGDLAVVALAGGPLMAFDLQVVRP